MCAIEALPIMGASSLTQQTLQARRSASQRMERQGGISRPLAFWGQRNSELALKNADSLAGYVLYEEKRFGY
ncbi:hypothetical protein PSAC2689_10310 [Paraburkholderia sacchari]